MTKSTTHSGAQTRKFAESFARTILRAKPSRHAVILALQGPLGAGKTTFAKGFARGLGIRQRVTSPTFVIAKRFAIPKHPDRQFFHLDCYRLRKPADLRAIGWNDMVNTPGNIILLEWPERVRRALPKHARRIEFIHGGGNVRIIRHS